MGTVQERCRELGKVVGGAGLAVDGLNVGREQCCLPGREMTTVTPVILKTKDEAHEIARD